MVEISERPMTGIGQDQEPTVRKVGNVGPDGTADSSASKPMPKRSFLKGLAGLLGIGAVTAAADVATGGAISAPARALVEAFADTQGPGFELDKPDSTTQAEHAVENGEKFDYAPGETRVVGPFFNSPQEKVEPGNPPKTSILGGRREKYEGKYYFVNDIMLVGPLHPDPGNPTQRFGKIMYGDKYAYVPESQMTFPDGFDENNPSFASIVKVFPANKDQQKPRILIGKDTKSQTMLGFGNITKIEKIDKPTATASK